MLLGYIIKCINLNIMEKEYIIESKGFKEGVGTPKYLQKQKDKIKELENMHKLEDKNITLTPLSLINKIGVFDYDPCGLQFHKTASKIISLPTDGLLEEWNGNVWLNPPYSNPKPFIKKLSEYGNGIALVLNSTDTVWFQEYGLKKADAMFLLKGRPKFTRLDMTEVSIMRGVVLFAYGKENATKLKECNLNGYYVPLNVL